MERQRRFFPFFSALLFVLVSMISQNLYADCLYEPDAPDCYCFKNDPCTNYCIWDPGEPGEFIQDVAINTVGVKEACYCTDPDLPPYVTRCLDDDSGRPYYQMVLGMNTEAGALTAAYLLFMFGSHLYDARQEWCSETISYWHREAGIPYSGGYRNDWHHNWITYSVPHLRFWYVVEDFPEGRGRWIKAEDELDYENFQLGVTVPVPGSYVAYTAYDAGPTPGWIDVGKFGHSLMINEMWVHTDAAGNVFKVQVSLLEGNSDKQVKDSRVWDDILELSPQGSKWIGTTKKIYGFGVDLDENREPIYDASRLHFVPHPEIISLIAGPVNAADPVWSVFSQNLSDVAAYAALMRQTGGPQVTHNAVFSKISGIPDGKNQWVFGEEPGEVVVDIDLLAGHPFGIKGIELLWEGSHFPAAYTVRFAGEEKTYQDAEVPDLSNLNPPQSPVYPIPALFTQDEKGLPIRYIKLIFPEGSFPTGALLQDIRFHYRDGPWEEEENIPEEIYKEVPVDIKPGSCPNPVNVKSKGKLPVAILGTPDFDVSTIDPASVRLEGSLVPVHWSVEDVSRPLSPPLACEPCKRRPPKRPDGFADLTLKFSTPELMALLSTLGQGTDCRKLLVTARLKEDFGGTPILGYDFIKILHK